jgi:hypothetical protein
MSTSSNPALALPPALAHAFAPVHKGALGLAVGLTLGASIALLTTFHLAVRPENGPDIALLTQFFYGYSVSVPGIAIGFLWGAATGFVSGWLGGLIRNFTLRAWILVVHTRSALSQPFLDDL